MGIIKVKLHFSDDKVCKNYLCGTCPHIVFTNTVSPRFRIESKEGGKEEKGELDLNESQHLHLLGLLGISCWYSLLASQLTYTPRHPTRLQKMDLGPCPRAHQEKLQEEFAEAKAANPDDPAVQRIEGEWQRNIFGFVDDCDRRIHASQRRLEKTPEENAKTTALVSLTASFLPLPLPSLLSLVATSTLVGARYSWS